MHFPGCCRPISCVLWGCGARWTRTPWCASSGRGCGSAWLRGGSSSAEKVKLIARASHRCLKPPKAMADGNCPASDGVFAFPMENGAGAINAVKRLPDGRRERADDDKRPAAERLCVAYRIGPPQVVLTLTVAQRRADRIHRRL